MTATLNDYIIMEHCKGRQEQLEDEATRYRLFRLPRLFKWTGLRRRELVRELWRRNKDVPHCGN